MSEALDELDNLNGDLIVMRQQDEVQRQTIADLRTKLSRQAKVIEGLKAALERIAGDSGAWYEEIARAALKLAEEK